MTQDQLSDKYDGDFSAADEAILIELGRLASVVFEDTRRTARAQRRGDAIGSSAQGRDEDPRTQDPTP